MQDQPHSKSINASLEARSIESPPLQGIASTVLSFLAFGNFGLRLGLQITSAIFVFALLRATFPWQALGASDNYAPLLSWFLACAVVVIADYCVFYHATNNFRLSYRYDFTGQFSKALRALDSISPFGNSLVRCQPTLFHLRRAEIIGHSGNEAQAVYELELARKAGLDVHDYYLVKSEILKHREDLSEARTEVENALQVCSNSAALALEHALLSLYERNDWRSTKKSLEHITKLPEALHHSGDSTTHLAKAFHQVTKLWTGEAEEGLEGLNGVIDELRSAVQLVESIRPILSQLILERAFYYATHSEPDQAQSDIKIGLALCNLPRQTHLARLTAEELKWRHDLETPIK